MDTKSLIIENATILFQQKGYKGVGINEILTVCNVTKGAMYHHFPYGKEELLVACLHSLNEAITTDIEEIFERSSTTGEAMKAIFDKLIADFESKGTISGYTFSSMVSEMATVSEPIRTACAELYGKMRGIYFQKLIADGFSKEVAASTALTMIASVEGAMMLCLTEQSAEPLRVVSQVLPILLKEI